MGVLPKWNGEKGKNMYNSAQKAVYSMAATLPQVTVSLISWDCGNRAMTFDGGRLRGEC
jgi:hypothetical protein